MSLSYALILFTYLSYACIIALFLYGFTAKFSKKKLFGFPFLFMFYLLCLSWSWVMASKLKTDISFKDQLQPSHLDKWEPSPTYYGRQICLIKGLYFKMFFYLNI